MTDVQCLPDEASDYQDCCTCERPGFTGDAYGRGLCSRAELKQANVIYREAPITLSRLDRAWRKRPLEMQKKTETYAVSDVLLRGSTAMTAGFRLDMTNGSCDPGSSRVLHHTGLHLNVLPLFSTRHPLSYLRSQGTQAGFSWKVPEKTHTAQKKPQQQHRAAVSEHLTQKGRKEVL